LLLFLLRATFAHRLRRAYHISGGPVRALGALLVGEALIFVSAAVAAVRSRVVWRGRAFRVGKDGHLDPIAD
jgi:hypothetical protein